MSCHLWAQTFPVFAVWIGAGLREQRLKPPCKSRSRSRLFPIKKAPQEIELKNWNKIKIFLPFLTVAPHKFNYTTPGARATEEAFQTKLIVRAIFELITKETKNAVAIWIKISLARTTLGCSASGPHEASSRASLLCLRPRRARTVKFP